MYSYSIKFTLRFVSSDEIHLCESSGQDTSLSHLCLTGVLQLFLCNGLCALNKKDKGCLESYIQAGDDEILVWKIISNAKLIELMMSIYLPLIRHCFLFYVSLT